MEPEAFDPQQKQSLGVTGRFPGTSSTLALSVNLMFTAKWLQPVAMPFQLKGVDTLRFRRCKRVHVSNDVPNMLLNDDTNLQIVGTRKLS